MTFDLRNFEYRREKVDVKEVFPNFKKQDFIEFIERHFPPKNVSKNTRILQVAMGMKNGGYEYFLKNYGFWDDKYSAFSGHCHQITPILALVLSSLDFHASYLECRRVDPDTLKPIPPENENSEMKDEFCRLGRIPYCCLEVTVYGEVRYISGKHIDWINSEPKSLLTPECHRDATDLIRHQKEPTKSGMYLKVIQKEPFIWRKQVINKDSEPEFFMTFAHMKLEI
mgnify:FL=1